MSETKIIRTTYEILTEFHRSENEFCLTHISLPYILCDFPIYNLNLTF